MGNQRMSEERRLAPASAVSAAREMQDQVEPQKLRVVEVDDVRSAREKHAEKPDPTHHRPPEPANLLRNQRQPNALDAEIRLRRGRGADDLDIVARPGQAPRLAVEDADVTDRMNGRGDHDANLALRQVDPPPTCANEPPNGLARHSLRDRGGGVTPTPVVSAVSRRPQGPHRMERSLNTVSSHMHRRAAHGSRFRTGHARLIPHADCTERVP